MKLRTGIKLIVIIFLGISFSAIGQKVTTDSIAINLVLNIPEVSETLMAHQNDSTVSNKLYLEQTPNERDNFYYIRLAQFFTYSDHTVTLNYFRVNPNNGEINVMNTIEGEYISLTTWRKRK